MIDSLWLAAVRILKEFQSISSSMMSNKTSGAITDKAKMIKHSLQGAGFIRFVPSNLKFIISGVETNTAPS